MKELNLVELAKVAGGILPLLNPGLVTTPPEPKNDEPRDGGATYTW